MTPAEVRELQTEELSKRVGELRRQLWKAHFSNSTGGLADTSSLPKMRQDLARVLTVLGERARSGDSAAKAATKSSAASKATPKVKTARAEKVQTKAEAKTAEIKAHTETSAAPAAKVSKPP